MRRAHIIALAVLIVILGIVAFIFWRYAPSRALLSSNTTAATSSAAASVRVSGDHLTRDGQPFVMQGFQITAFSVVPQLLLPKDRQNIAQENWGAAELAAAKSWNATTIRFQLDAYGFDPQGKLFSDAYVSELTKAVALTESQGFAVVISARAEDQQSREAAGAPPDPDQMPNAVTLASDLEFAKLFGNDQNVVIELYNEPRLRPSGANSANGQAWTYWQHGGADPANGEVMVGMQTIIDQMRAAGAKNVFAIDGLEEAKTFAGMPSLTDPLGQLIYAIHPGLPDNATEAAWQANFGYLADAGKVVVNTQWDEPTEDNQPGTDTNDDRWCERYPYDTPQLELAYLESKHISTIAYALDVDQSTVIDYPATYGTPSTYVGKQCGDADGGPGELLKEQFLSW